MEKAGILIRARAWTERIKKGKNNIVVVFLSALNNNLVFMTKKFYQQIHLVWNANIQKSY